MFVLCVAGAGSPTAEALVAKLEQQCMVCILNQFEIYKIFNF